RDFWVIGGLQVPYYFDKASGLSLPILRRNVSNLKLESSFCFSSLRESEQLYASILLWFSIMQHNLFPSGENVKLSTSYGCDYKLFGSHLSCLTLDTDMYIFDAEIGIQKSNQAGVATLGYLLSLELLTGGNLVILYLHKFRSLVSYVTGL
uniref:Uncharacterized protein n=1 Tax=Cucumis melo TaxID=3656 RepID=A0A9I9E1G2_CUCME